MTDPFAEPTVEQDDNWVSFTFNSAPGYDRIGATAHGTPEFVAKVFGIENFDGKLSTLMKRAVVVDEYFKQQYQGTPAQGKA
ncbi:MAG: hypothetical protein IRZ03_08360 [Acidobacterium ailaaui]|nr:hypothetical protein [Pseudacidobacterium ailaaui]